MQLAQAAKRTDRRSAGKGPSHGGRAPGGGKDAPSAPGTPAGASAPSAKPERPSGSRTCVACRQPGERGELVRLIEDPSGAIAVDPRSRAGGRGAWVHPTKGCIATAAKRHGAERSLKVSIREVDPAVLIAQTREAFGRKLRSLILVAQRTGGLAIGATAVAEALERQRVPLLLVATDAGETSRALAADETLATGGTAVRAFATKEDLGAVLGRNEVAVVALSDQGIAAELVATIDRIAGLEG